MLYLLYIGYVIHDAPHTGYHGTFSVRPNYIIFEVLCPRLSYQKHIINAQNRPPQIVIFT